MQDMSVSCVPPVGPISARVAIDCLARVLNADPLDDLAVHAWASERKMLRGELAKTDTQHRRETWRKIDAANALLLRAHPALRHEPIHLAMLEAVYKLDDGMNVGPRLPSPCVWHDAPDIARMHYDRVIRVTRARIGRALALNAEPMVEFASNLIGIDYSSP